MPHTQAQDAERVAQLLLDSVRQVHLYNGQRLSFSAGIATMEAHDDQQGETLLRRADKALCQAKHAGRGKIVVLTSATELDGNRARLIQQRTPLLAIGPLQTSSSRR